jgi:hypothetical protein
MHGDAEIWSSSAQTEYVLSVENEFSLYAKSVIVRADGWDGVHEHAGHNEFVRAGTAGA